MPTHFKILIATIVLTFSFYSLAEAKQCQMSEQGKAECCNKKSKQAIRAYKAAMKTMHHDMMVGYTGDVDTDFARGMIPHHQGAVDMAQIVLKYGKDEEIKSFAEWIISIQNQEIAQMKHWLTRKGAPAGERVSWYDDAVIAESDAAMHTMHREMDIAYTGDADVDFVLGMIPHHQGAIDMAAIQFKHGSDFEMNKLATGIVTSQNGEIAKMRRWLKARGVDFHRTNQYKKKQQHLH